MDKETYEGLIIAVVMAGKKKAEAGLKYAASGEYQDYPPGILELGVALDALNLIANDVINCVLANCDEEWEKELGPLDFAAAGFATIANNTKDEQIKNFALDNGEEIMIITEEELENRLGHLVDNAVSARTWTTAPFPPSMCLEALTSMLRDLTAELRSLYVDVVGSDPWADHPQEIQP